MRHPLDAARGAPPPDGTGSAAPALDACMDGACFGRTYPGLVALAPAASSPRQTLSLSASSRRPLTGTAAVVLGAGAGRGARLRPRLTGSSLFRATGGVACTWRTPTFPGRRFLPGNTSTPPGG